MPKNTLRSDDTPNALGELGAMQGPPQPGVVAKRGIPDHRRAGETGDAHLPPERQRELPFRAERHRVGNPRPRWAGVSHASGG